MADKRIIDLGDAAAVGHNIRKYKIEVDEDANVESEALELSELLRDDDLYGQGVDSVDFQACTPKSVLGTISQESILGLIRIASDTLAVAATNTANALVPSNLNPIFDARFKKTKSYVVGDFDEVAGNYTTLSVTAFDEMVVGKYTVMQGYIVVTIPEVDNIEIVLNATQTPLTIKAMNSTRFVTSFYTSHGGICLTSGGKLKMIIGTGDNTSWSPGTYEFAIDLSYFSE